MKWPWVSRVDHDRMVAEINSANRVAIEQMHRTTERLFAANADLTSKYHELARPVTVAPAPPATLNGTIGTEPKEVDPVARTIREQAGRDTHLANHLRQYARELRSAGLNDDAIVGKLVEWQTSEPEDHAASA